MTKIIEPPDETRGSRRAEASFHTCAATLGATAAPRALAYSGEVSAAPRAFPAGALRERVCESFCARAAISGLASPRTRESAMSGKIVCINSDSSPGPQGPGKTPNEISRDMLQPCTMRGLGFHLGSNLASSPQKAAKPPNKLPATCCNVLRWDTPMPCAISEGPFPPM